MKMETKGEKHQRLHEEAEQRTRDITKYITSNFINLDEDERCSRFQKHRGQGAWGVAGERVKEAQSPSDLQRVEISYHDGLGFHQQMVYVIGHGTIHYSPRVLSEHGLFYLDKWEEEPRSSGVKPVKISRLKSLRFLDIK